MPTVDSALAQTLAQTLENLPSQVYLFQNRKKPLLNRIYHNLQVQIGSNRRVITVDVNDLSPGFLTNPCNSTFIEPPHVVLLLTKKHNLRQTKLLQELDMMKVPYTLITLGTYRRSQCQVYQVTGVRALYKFMYTLSSLRGLKTYQQFAMNYKLSKDL